jgi:hypothetical protein
MSLSEIDKGIQAIAREEHEKQKQQLLGELDRIVKQNRVSIDTKPNSSETSAIVYYVPEDNSQKVTLELYALKNHKELLDRVIEVKKTSSSRLLLGILLIYRRLAVPEIDFPTINQAVNIFSYHDLIGAFPCANYDCWDTLLKKGLTKAHLLENEWLTFSDVCKLLPVDQILNSLVNQMDFSAKDFMLEGPFCSNDIMLILDVKAKLLLKIGITRKILTSKHCPFTLEFLVNNMGFNSEILLKRLAFTRKSFTTLIKQRRLKSIDHAQQLLKVAIPGSSRKPNGPVSSISNTGGNKVKLPNASVKQIKYKDIIL